MSSSNNDYNNGNNNNGGYHLSRYLSSLSGHHQDIIRNPFNHHQLTASPGQMVTAVPESLADYMALHSNNALNQKSFESPEVSREIKKAVKKDRHSKIHTAQGLRDRRVRLSIGIAREFFDLQDMLGFDKASKTLDWLLRKSKKAINEVVQAKKLNNDDEGGLGNDGGDVEEDEDENDGGSNSFVNGSSPEYSKEECEVKKKSEVSNNISSERSRSKARGKAKEKTMVYDHPETVSDITQSEVMMDPFNRSINFNEGEDMMTHSFFKEAIEEFGNQEPILTERKNINLPMNMGHFNGTFLLTDQGSTSNYNTIDLPQILDYNNYDQNPFDDQSFCAVTDTNFPRGFP